MPSGHVFPYGITLEDGARVTTFPVAEVGFAPKEGDRITLFLLIDSGAVISALPKTDAEVLGIQAEDGTRFPIAGIDGIPIQGWRHEISVFLNGIPYHLPIVFLDKPDAPRILGREGVFDQFTVVFEENKQRSALVGMQSKESQAIGKIVDVLAKK